MSTPEDHAWNRVGIPATGAGLPQARTRFSFLVARLAGPWRRFVIRCQARQTRHVVARSGRRHWLGDAPSAYWCVPGGEGRPTFHVIASRDSSPEAVAQFEARILPGASKEPADWLFVLASNVSPDAGRDQLSLAARAARRLRIPLRVDVLVEATSEAAIDHLARHGLPSGVEVDDLYAAVCYDALPKGISGNLVDKGFHPGEVHGTLHPRWEAVRLRRQLHWAIELPRLEGIVTRLLGRIEHERPGALDEFYDNRLRARLHDAALELNRQRVARLQEEHPGCRHALLMLDDAHLAVLPLALPGLPEPNAVP